jgi:alkylation response protein AidB-like acyl-CoA dehydrogenase
MKFAFTADQLALRDALRDLLDKECTPDVARVSHEPELWKRLAEMGVQGLRRELNEIDLVLLLEEAGRALVPGPLFETAAVAVPALEEAEEEQWLERASSGDAVVAVGLGDQPVAHGDVADLLILETDGAIHAIPAAEVELEPVPEMADARKLFRVRWDPQPETQLKVDESLTFDRAVLAAAAELIGIADRVIEMAAGYAKEREQFGKPIGSFQAVKHLLATALMRLEFARPAVYRAANSVAKDVPARSRDVSMAKAFASDAATLACRNALQVHGAIGYTEEHHLHLWLKRGWALAFAWGDAGWHRDRVGQTVLG